MDCILFSLFDLHTLMLKETSFSSQAILASNALEDKFHHVITRETPTSLARFSLKLCKRSPMR